MSPRARKSKGKKYETKIASVLHQFFVDKIPEYDILTQEHDDDKLKPSRDFASGNFSNSDGDINLGLLRKYFPFSIECKHWKTLDLSLNSLLNNKIKILINVYEEQAQEKAKQTAGLVPIVVFAANRTSNFCLFNKNTLKFDIEHFDHVVLMGEYCISTFDDFLNSWYSLLTEYKDAKSIIKL